VGTTLPLLNIGSQNDVNRALKNIQLPYSNSLYSGREEEDNNNNNNNNNKTAAA
jgi:hypothetical protein